MKYFLKKASYIKCLLSIIERIYLHMEGDKFVRSESARDSIPDHIFHSAFIAAKAMNPDNAKMIFSNQTVIVKQ